MGGKCDVTRMWVPVWRIPLVLWVANKVYCLQQYCRDTSSDAALRFFRQIEKVKSEVRCHCESLAGSLLASAQ